ncbi:MAG: tail tape measure protein [Sphingobium sp.]|nr:tail tape measure protein [Sphingobium sp.]
MDEEIDRLVIAVRADTQGFTRDVADMRQGLEGPLGQGAQRAGKMIEDSLSRALRTGKLGFEDLRTIALSVMSSIAQNALSAGLSALGGGRAGSGGGGLLGSLAGIAMAAIGAPGRATGGPVSPGRAYRVGENGPELFVPSSSGSVVANGGGGASGGRDVRVSININAPQNNGPQALAKSSRQIARSVRSALSQ